MCLPYDPAVPPEYITFKTKTKNSESTLIKRHSLKHIFVSAKINN